jgi:hypothetical protein
MTNLFLGRLSEAWLSRVRGKFVISWLEWKGTFSITDKPRGQAQIPLIFVNDPKGSFRSARITESNLGSFDPGPNVLTTQPPSLGEVINQTPRRSWGGLGLGWSESFLML